LLGADVRVIAQLRKIICREYEEKGQGTHSAVEPIIIIIIIIIIIMAVVILGISLLFGSTKAFQL
jgi:flagellar basal body-associated protein FliL